MTTATDTELDPYGLSSGLPDDFIGEITDAVFSTDAAYNNGDTVLFCPDLKTDLDDRPLVSEKISTGTGWEILDGGARIVAESGKARQFNRSSKMGLLIQHAIEAGAGDVLRGRGLPTDVSTWIGLTFKWVRKPIKGFNDEVKDVLLPSEFLGVKGEASTNGSAPAASNGNGAAPAVSTADIPAKVLAKLTAAAKKAGTHDEFMEAAFDIDGVDDNAAAVALVSDEAQYVALKG